MNEKDEAMSILIFERIIWNDQVITLKNELQTAKSCTECLGLNNQITKLSKENES